MFKPNAIVVHCSASRWGDAAEIDRWHKAQGWRQIGYHGVILNGRRTNPRTYDPTDDGWVEQGRPETMMGAHCKGDHMNGRALGVCLIGMPRWDGYPTVRQIDRLVQWCVNRCRRYGISPDAITQHSDHEPGKPLCASLPMAKIRKRVKAMLHG